MGVLRKAIILAAGYGTRFLPVTKAMPKEMLPVVDKPVIQYVVEDAVAAGISDIVIVTSAQKRAIEDHFDTSFELEFLLENGGKQGLLEQVRSIAELANFIYVRQKKVKGTLPAIQCGLQAIGDEPFLAIWGDDFYVGTPSRCKQMASIYEEFKAPVLGVIETTHPEDGGRYGFVAGEEIRPGVVKVTKIIEKPGVGKAPSNYATVGGFIGTPELMRFAPQVQPMANGEYSYTEVLALYLASGQPVYAKKIENSTYHDCGNKLDYIKTNIELALQNEAMKDELAAYLQTLVPTPIALPLSADKRTVSAE